MDDGEPTFQEHAEQLSAKLCAQRGLTFCTLPDGDATLTNDLMRIRVFPGWPKDPYVHVSITYTDKSLLGQHTYFELWRYVRFRDAWSSFPMTWHWDGERQLRARGRPYSHIGSPYQLLEAFVFLATHCGPLFEPDREHLREFAAWMDDEQRRYNERVSRR